MPMDVVLLCGGKGTRAYPYTQSLPKALLEVAGMPILRHVMDIYAAQGFTRFVLAAGYRAENIEEFAATTPSAWHVDVVDTGDETNTAARIRAVAERLSPTFLATYGDGLADIDLEQLVQFHQRHGGSASMTTVPLPSPYGTVEFEPDGTVTAFAEKPRLRDHYINAGYFVFDRQVFEDSGGDDLEREVLPDLAASGQLHAFVHHGFWRSMDTYKDALELGELARQGAPPWTFGG